MRDAEGRTHQIRLHIQGVAQAPVASEFLYVWEMNAKQKTSSERKHVVIVHMPLDWIFLAADRRAPDPGLSLESTGLRALADLEDQSFSRHAKKCPHGYLQLYLGGMMGTTHAPSTRTATSEAAGTSSVVEEVPAGGPLGRAVTRTSSRQDIEPRELLVLIVRTLDLDAEAWERPLWTQTRAARWR